MATAYLIKADNYYPEMVCANQADAEEMCLALTQDFTRMIYCNYWNYMHEHYLKEVQKEHPTWPLWMQVEKAIRNRHRYYEADYAPLYTFQNIPFMEE